jgi:phosphoribosylamine-glycine ligase
MLDLIDGNDSFKPSLEHDVCVVMTIPDYPNSRFTKKEVSGVPVYNLDKENPYRDLLAPCELMSGQAPNEEGQPERLMVSCGDYLVVAIGLGDSVREASTQAYKAADSVEIPNNLQMRTDIGDKMRFKIPKLQEYGFCQEWKY